MQIFSPTIAGRRRGGHRPPLGFSSVDRDTVVQLILSKGPGNRSRSPSRTGMPRSDAEAMVDEPLAPRGPAESSNLDAEVPARRS